MASTKKEVDASQNYQTVNRHIVHDVPALVESAYRNRHDQNMYYPGTHDYLAAIGVTTQLETILTTGKEPHSVAKTLNIKIDFSRVPILCHKSFAENIAELVLAKCLAPEISDYLESCGEGE